MLLVDGAADGTPWRRPFDLFACSSSDDDDSDAEPYLPARTDQDDTRVALAAFVDEVVIAPLRLFSLQHHHPQGGACTTRAPGVVSFAVADCLDRTPDADRPFYAEFFATRTFADALKERCYGRLRDC